MVEGDAVGPADVRVDEGDPGGRVAVHRGRLDLGDLAPVGPEHEAVLGGQRDGPGENKIGFLFEVDHD